MKTCDELVPRFCFFWILRKFLVFTLMVAEISWREEMDACRCWLKQFCLVPSCTRLKGKEMKEKIIKMNKCLHMHILAKKYGSSSFTWVIITMLVKFVYSEKATKVCEIFIVLLSYVVPVKSKVKILQTFVAFSGYMSFTPKKFLA